MCTHDLIEPGPVDYDRIYMAIQTVSVKSPMTAQSVRALAVEAWRRAEAMGLVEPDGGRLETANLARLMKRLRDAGIARTPALRLDNVELPSVGEAEALLRLVIAALEASPVAKHEWPAVSRVLDPDLLAPLLGISVSSLRRYLSGERDADDVAARLHHVALIVGDLAGAYQRSRYPSLVRAQTVRARRQDARGAARSRLESRRFGPAESPGACAVARLTRGHMIVFRQADPRYPFLWSDVSQPAARWHAVGEGPAHYFADTPDGAWAELLRHEESPTQPTRQPFSGRCGRLKSKTSRSSKYRCRLRR